MYRYGKQSAAAQRAAERREREDSAPRLAAQVPDLVSLRLEIEERSSSAATQPKYLRRIVVASAPALFFIPCADPHCIDGGHDVTWPVMQSLQSRRRAFRCNNGNRNSAAASHRLGNCAARLRLQTGTSSSRNNRSLLSSGQSPVP